MRIFFLVLSLCFLLTACSVASVKNREVSIVSEKEKSVILETLQIDLPKADKPHRVKQTEKAISNKHKNTSTKKEHSTPVEVAGEAVIAKKPDEDELKLLSFKKNKLMRRQSLFATVCEQHPTIIKLSEKYIRSIDRFYDGKVEKQNAIVLGFSFVVFSYKIKTADTRSVATIHCVVEESVVQSKPNFKIVSLQINNIGINIK